MPQLLIRYVTPAKADMANVLFDGAAVQYTALVPARFPESADEAMCARVAGHQLLLQPNVRLLAVYARRHRDDGFGLAESVGEADYSCCTQHGGGVVQELDGAEGQRPRLGLVADLHYGRGYVGSDHNVGCGDSYALVRGLDDVVADEEAFVVPHLLVHR